MRWLTSQILSQRGALFPWAPVCLAVGIGGYFSLRWEPEVWALWLCLAFAALGAFLALRWARELAPLVWAVALVALGFALAGARAHWVAGPVLEFRYYGPVEGRVVAIDRSASDAVRVTLDRVVLERMSPERTPTRVRVSLHGAQVITPQPGATLIATAHLGPPGGAVEPGGFDFRRHAWFLRLGAVGYTRVPALTLAPPERGQWVFKARMWYSERVRALMPGPAGAFAAAVTTGDRSGMAQAELQALRDSNLAHLLAISGLHMGLLAGFVFTALRLGLLLVPGLRHGPVKRIAAVGALAAASLYLALSGGNVATERAFVMAAVALVAVMLNRRALSLRGVALAALIVLGLRPEALLSPGFQMSFAATTALVAVFEVLGRRPPSRLRWRGPLMGLFISSSVAGLATAPVAMAHFNQMAHYGLLANVISVPVMGALVVPMAVVAALLLPFGLDWLPLWGMSLGLEWILAVAGRVASWPGAVGYVVAPDTSVLALIGFGGVIVALWRGRGRLVGLAPMAVAAALWAAAERPEVLIAADGALVGVMTDTGRAVSRERGAGFTARVWLENDGGQRDQSASAALWPGAKKDRIAVARLAAGRVIHVQGKRAARAFDGCAPGDIVVANVDLGVGQRCEVFDPKRLRVTGALAVAAGPDGWEIETDAARAGARLWRPSLRRTSRRSSRSEQGSGQIRRAEVAATSP